jgi:hypothetical protein
MVKEIEVIVIKTDKKGEQHMTKEKRLAEVVIVPREFYLQSDIPVFEDQIEYRIIK